MPALYKNPQFLQESDLAAFEPDSRTQHCDTILRHLSLRGMREVLLQYPSILCRHRIIASTRCSKAAFAGV